MRYQFIHDRVTAQHASTFQVGWPETHQTPNVWNFNTTSSERSSQNFQSEENQSKEVPLMIISLITVAISSYSNYS